MSTNAPRVTPQQGLKIQSKSPLPHCYRKTGSREQPINKEPQ